MKGLPGPYYGFSSDLCMDALSHENVLPIWGVQREAELDEFISYIDNPPELTDERNAVIEKDRRKSWQAPFRRACGYCLPCPSGIEINLCARMSLLLRRMPPDDFLTEEGQAKMKKSRTASIADNAGLNVLMDWTRPACFEENYKDYKEVLAGKTVQN